jgi:hypothetical protein
MPSLPDPRPESDAGRSPDRHAYIFAALALLYVVPIWVTEFFPSQDGLSHIYNALIIKEYLNTQEFPLFQEYYSLDLSPLPNWFGHAALAGLMFVFEPLVAEKMMLSGYVLLFLFAGRYLIANVNRAGAPLALLLFPFVYNFFLQKGFYNFCFSIAFCLLGIGYWWAHRDEIRLKQAVVLNAVMLCCYLSHIVSAAITLLAIAMLWLVNIRRTNWKQYARQIPLLLPACILPVWFVLSHGAEANHVFFHWKALLAAIVRAKALVSFHGFQNQLGVFVATIFAILVVVKLREKIDWRGRRFRWDTTDGFLLVCLLCLGLYVTLPDGMSGGGFLTLRLSMYPFLLALPWLTLPRSVQWRTSLLGVLVLVASANVVYLSSVFPKMNSQLQEWSEGVEYVAPNSRILPIIFEPREGRIALLRHASGYHAAYTGGITWDNYEANTDYFPVRFRPEFDAVRPASEVIETSPGELEIERFLPVVDYILTWKMPHGSGIEESIESFYELVFDGQSARVYERR